MIDINTVDELQALLNRKMPRTRLSINFNQGESDYESKLNNYIEECGCQLGSIFLTIGIILSAVFVLLIKIPIWKEICTGLVFSLVMAIAGKYIGLLIARYRFYQTIRNCVNDQKRLVII